MRSTLELFSKALRLPLTSKRGNKDFYKGARVVHIHYKLNASSGTAMGLTSDCLLDPQALGLATS